MTYDTIRATLPAYPANESAVAIAYAELLGVPREAASPVTRAVAHPLAALNDIGRRLGAHWRAWLRERQESARLDALAPLAPHLLRDIGVSDEQRSIVLARRASQFERSSASPDAATIASRFGTW